MTVPEKTPATFTWLSLRNMQFLVFAHGGGNFGLLPQQQQFLHVMTFDSGLFRSRKPRETSPKVAKVPLRKGAFTVSSTGCQSVQ